MRAISNSPDTFGRPRGNPGVPPTGVSSATAPNGFGATDRKHPLPGVGQNFQDHARPTRDQPTLPRRGHRSARDGRWAHLFAYLFDAGAEAQAWADEVWGNREEDEAAAN
jgi:hypothetical protein